MASQPFVTALQSIHTPGVDPDNDLTVAAHVRGQFDGETVHDWDGTLSMMREAGWNFSLEQIQDRWTTAILPRVVITRARTQRAAAESAHARHGSFPPVIDQDYNFDEDDDKECNHSLTNYARHIIQSFASGRVWNPEVGRFQSPAVTEAGSELATHEKDERGSKEETEEEEMPSAGNNEHKHEHDHTASTPDNEDEETEVESVASGSGAVKVNKVDEYSELSTDHGPEKSDDSDYVLTPRTPIVAGFGDRIKDFGRFSFDNHDSDGSSAYSPGADEKAGKKFIQNNAKKTLKGKDKAKIYDMGVDQETTDSDVGNSKNEVQLYKIVVKPIYSNDYVDSLKSVDEDGNAAEHHGVLTLTSTQFVINGTYIQAWTAASEAATNLHQIYSQFMPQLSMHYSMTLADAPLDSMLSIMESEDPVDSGTVHAPAAAVPDEDPYPTYEEYEPEAEVSYHEEVEESPKSFKSSPGGVSEPRFITKDFTSANRRAYRRRTTSLRSNPALAEIQEEEHKDDSTY